MNPQQTTITSVLVANRGEIAQRIFRTARSMGLRSIAVFVDADAGAPFVSEADVSIRIPSYMDADAIVAAALAAGADALHPGYGFLSENAAFAAAVLSADIAWVGPSPRVIASMGDKIEAKKLAEAAGVPTLPATTDPTADSEVGYPLLVKASAGGGGKGMRVVKRSADLIESVASAKREAQSGFGDDTVFLERYVPKARHVEIQIMGDSYGTVVHFGERECSIQRRHQKVVEEAPSPGISAETRAAMTAAAVNLGRSMRYESAGTVEFLVDEESGDFFFLEVNTRLQVEHPVTEQALGGIDLVRMQLEIAGGEPVVAVDTDAMRPAIEVRLYAEDPSSAFLPATGILHGFQAIDGPNVRWDTGVARHSEVTVNFDPMLAKVIAWGPTRRQAALTLARELEQLHIAGVVTNRDFLVNVLRSPEFLAGDTTTDFIDRVQPQPTMVLSDADVQRAAIAGALWIQGRNRAGDPVWGNLPSGFRNGRLPPSQLTVRLGGAVHTVAYRANRNGTSFRAAVTDAALEPGDIDNVPLASTVRVFDWTAAGEIGVEIDGLRNRYWLTITASKLWVQIPTGTIEFDLVPKFLAPGVAGPAGGFLAPMPGVVLDVRIAAGDEVKKGQTLMILEAMKMEHHVSATEDGVIDEVFVKTGQQVDKDTVLLALVSDEAADHDG